MPHTYRVTHPRPVEFPGPRIEFALRDGFRTEPVGTEPVGRQRGAGIRA